jgi:hypothetical protein
VDVGDGGNAGCVDRLEEFKITLDLHFGNDPNDY